MSTPFSSFSKRSQRWLVAGLIVPWLIFAIVIFDWLPEAWRFEHWPRSLRTLSVTAFVLFVIAEVIFEVWYWLATSKGTSDD